MKAVYELRKCGCVFGMSSKGLEVAVCIVWKARWHCVSLDRSDWSSRQKGAVGTWNEDNSNEIEIYHYQKDQVLNIDFRNFDMLFIVCCPKK